MSSTPDVSGSPIAHGIAAEIELLLASGPPSIERLKAIVRIADEGRILLQTVAAVRARMGIVQASVQADGQVVRLRRSLGLRASGGEAT